MFETLLRLVLDADWSPGPWVWVHAFGELLGLLSVPSVLLARRAQPLGALVWILALLSLPYVGLLAWWALGRRHLHRPRARHRQASSLVRARLAERALRHPGEQPAPVLPFRVDSPAMPGPYPSTTDNRVDVLVDASEAYPHLEQMIRDARHHIHLLFYTFEHDATGARFLAALVEKARQGVEVRLLFDAVGSPDLNDRALAPLRAAGGRAAAFLPVRLRRRLTLNFRNHRKIVIVDAIRAFTGGMNIGDAYVKDWHDLALGLEGPAVDQLQEVFADDWMFATGEDLALPPYFGQHAQGPRADALPPGEDPAAGIMVVASGPDQRYNLTHDALFMAVTGAQRRIWLITPYLIPSPTLLTALRGAVYRGVDVRLLLPARSDVPVARLAARSYYPELLDSGVRIFEYGPCVLHAKAMIFDGSLSALGSANLDTRSFRLNFEVSCFVRSEPVNRAIAAVFERDLTQSEEIQQRDLSRRSVADVLTESAAHLLSPLL